MNRILSDSAFVILEDDQQTLIREQIEQTLIREQIEQCIKDDINKFFDENPPRSLYPYEERVMAAIRTVFSQNIELVGFDDEESEVKQAHVSDNSESEEQDKLN
ncbi:uncharacterized protein PG998_011343 [Apiospora kogelbergensis]|uniref:uncharacterized protein n=1 Tax=Apiospora kogelbergensis TaxID=1337665 RepID=UPI003130B402